MSIIPHKKKYQDVTLILLGLLGLGIIVLVAVMLMMWLHTQDVDNMTTEYVDDVVTVQGDDDASLNNTSTSTASVDLHLAYATGIAELQTYVQDRRDTVPRMLAHSEDGLLAMRVPREMQDVHLAAVLNIATLRAQVGESDDETLVAKLIQILQTLVQK